MAAQLTQLLRRRPDLVAVLGCLIGFSAATFILSGGIDAGLFYMRPYWPGTTAPAWVHLLTAPFVPLPWPLPWTALVALSVVGIWAAQRVWGDAPWWMILLSVPMVWNIWIGQIEILPVWGATIGWLVVTRRIAPVWLGLALILLAVKSQVGVGLGLLYTFWVWRDYGLKALVAPAGLALSVIAITVAIYGNWIPDYLHSLAGLAPQEQMWNAAVFFPFGLLAIPVALMPIRMSRRRRTRMVAAATLLASPYFGTYHAVTLMAMEQRRAVFYACCAIAPPMIAFKSQQFGSVIPLVALALDAFAALRTGDKEDTEKP